MEWMRGTKGGTTTDLVADDFAATAAASFGTKATAWGTAHSTHESARTATITVVIAVAIMRNREQRRIIIDERRCLRDGFFLLVESKEFKFGREQKLGVSFGLFRREKMQFDLSLSLYEDVSFPILS
jgi:hypothetical protein